MKTILFVLVCLSIIVACNKKENMHPPKIKVPDSINTSDSIIVYDIYRYEEAKKNAEASGKRLIVIDTACINGKERARKDIKKGKLTYYFIGRMGTTTYEVEKVKESFLKKGIKIDYAYGYATCIPLIGGEEFDDLCYEGQMNKEFEKRYGKAFIDSMMVTREQQRLESSKKY